MVQNIYVSETAVVGGLWHEQSALSTHRTLSVMTGVACTRTAATGTAVIGNVGMRNATPRFVAPLAALTGTPAIAVKAPAKQAPQPRGSLAPI